jgi:hypothetical protein
VEEGRKEVRVLTDVELDLVGGGKTGTPPVWNREPPPKPQPGGPILITCIVGQGCMTRPA